MENNRFDAITKVFGDRQLSRRRALVQGGAVLAAGAFAHGAWPGQAQEATPEAHETPEPEAENPGGPTMMFVQTFQSGSVARTEGQEGRYTVKLKQGSGQTIYFSDRPDRIVGSTPTGQFLEGLGFPEDNPPNAALIVETEPGETDIAVVELFNPMYDPTSHGVTYDVEVLANWGQSLEMDFTETPTDLAELAPTFGAAQLFIDDCPDWPISCYRLGEYVGGLGVRGNCWSWRLGWCVPCLADGSQGSKSYQEIMTHFGAECDKYVSACNGACTAYSTWT